MTKDQSPRRNDVWKCPKCDLSITVHVNLSEAPRCDNKAVHSTKYVEMDLVKSTDRTMGV